MRRLIGVAGIILLVTAVCAWLVRPTPGRSLFADWNPTSKGKVWSIVGAPHSSKVAFVDRTGAFQPLNSTYSVHYFLFDRDNDRLLRATGSERALLQGCLPLVSARYGDLAASYETFRSGGGCISTVTISNESKSARRVSLFVVAVPYQLSGRQCGSADVRIRRSGLSVGGTTLISCDSQPTAGAAYASRKGDITGFVRNGVLPRTRFAAGGLRDITSGALRFDLIMEPGRAKRLVFRSLDASGVPVEQARDEFVCRWRSSLGRVGLKLPDKKCEDCFRASTAYLLMLTANGKPVPGPTKYDLFWVRDCAYLMDALYYTGHADRIPPALDHLRSMQLPNGGFRARAGANDDELDAPGEAIYALVQQYRRSGDKKWLGSVWPSIASACRYVQSKRSGSGILPASLSAEDLGKANQQHYWDDFWCIRGLRDAAFAARELGRGQDTARISAEAESLTAATRASIEQTLRRRSIDYIPNGPDEWSSSSMARGTSCALWPCEALGTSDPLVAKSFDIYWNRWIAPSNGGFVHRGHYWPYAGMDLAQGYVMLGQRERAWEILKWTLDHDPTGGFFSWPEGMCTDDLALAEGDMPHGWMCAAYVSLVRNMLVRESNRRLVLLPGVPDEWLRPGARIAVRDFPTEFGKVSFRAEMVGRSLRVTVWGARPPLGYKAMRSCQLSVVSSQVDN